MKREALDHLSLVTRFTEEELKNLKTIYCHFAEPRVGLSPENFERCLGLQMNIEKHPFSKELFMVFDKGQDGLVDF